MTPIVATRASKRDAGFTYRTSQFKNWKFDAGNHYIFEYDTGELIPMRASRNGKTLYSLVSAEQTRLDVPVIGHPVLHTVARIYKALKQEI